MTNPQDSDIGPEIQRERKRRGLSQQALADLIGVTKAAVSNWERDYRCPESGVIEELGNALEVDPEILRRWKSHAHASRSNEILAPGLRDALSTVIRGYHAVIPIAGWQADLLHDDEITAALTESVSVAQFVGLDKFVIVLRDGHDKVRDQLLDRVRHLDNPIREAQFSWCYQDHAGALWDAVRIACKNKPDMSSLLLLLPDEKVSLTGRIHLKSTVEQCAIRGNLLVAASKANRESLSSYGQVVTRGSGRVQRLLRLEERPGPSSAGNAKRILRAVGHYLLRAEAFRKTPNSGDRQKDQAGLAGILSRTNETIQCLVYSPSEVRDVGPHNWCRSAQRGTTLLATSPRFTETESRPERPRIKHAEAVALALWRKSRLSLSELQHESHLGSAANTSRVVASMLAARLVCKNREGKEQYIELTDEGQRAFHLNEFTIWIQKQHIRFERIVGMAIYEIAELAPEGQYSPEIQTEQLADKISNASVTTPWQKLAELVSDVVKQVRKIARESKNRPGEIKELQALIERCRKERARLEADVVAAGDATSTDL